MFKNFGRALTVCRKMYNYWWCIFNRFSLWHSFSSRTIKKGQAMSVNTGMLADGTECVWVHEAGAVLDEQRADLSPGQTLLIKARKRVKPLKLGLKTSLAVFLWCLLPRLNAPSLFVLLAFFFFLLISLSAPAMPTLQSLSCMLRW